MNVLYEAVMILGRSMTEIDRTGWLCGAIGETEGPKCVNGVLTISAGDKVANYIFANNARKPDALRVAAIALMRTTPVNLSQVKEVCLLTGENGPLPTTITAFENPEAATLKDLGNTLALINDFSEIDEPDEDPYLDRRAARAWFEKAFDLLAQELPLPLPVVTIGAPGEVATA